MCWFSELTGLTVGDRLAAGQREEGAAGPGGVSLAIMKSWSYSLTGKLLRKEERVLLMLEQLIRSKVRAQRTGQLI